LYSPSVERKIKTIVVGHNIIKFKIPISLNGGIVIGHSVFDSLMINKDVLLAIINLCI
jgi:hypothetical protein